jgi:hypothetical protein
MVKVKGNYCAGSAVAVSAPYGAGNTYLWSTGSTTRTILITGAGTYSAVVYEPAGSSYTTVVTQWIEKPLPGIGIETAGSTAFCPGDSLLLHAITGQGYRVEWSTGQSGDSIFVKSQGLFTVTGTNTFGCSKTSVPIEITLLQAPDHTITFSGPLSFCSGDSISLSATSQQGNTYLWSNGAGMQTITVKETGSYSVTITSSAGCKATSEPAPITVFPLPTANIGYTGSTTFCPGSSILLSASAGNGYQYVWSSGENSQSILVQQTGSYRVTIADLNGCSNESLPVQITVKFIDGDLNSDRWVNTSDYLMVVGKFGKNCAGCPEDLIVDGLVNTSDYLVVVGKFGQSCDR